MNLQRNDPCWCGSGKKYKKCCLADEDTILTKMVNEDLAQGQANLAAYEKEFNPFQSETKT
jgi:hypothetical protein